MLPASALLSQKAVPVHAHSESEIRKSFLNCSKGAAQRLALPQHLDQLEWDGQIVLGWIDPKLPKSAKDRYSSVGSYICSDLACSDYTLGRRKPDGVRQMEETLSVEERSQRTLTDGQGLVERVAQSLGKWSPGACRGGYSVSLGCAVCTCSRTTVLSST